MKAVVITRAGGPEVLEVREVATPEPIGDLVRVHVRAAGVNRADLLQRAGGYAAPPGSPADIPGLEFAGEVDAVGPFVTSWKPGQRVMGIAGGGLLAFPPSRTDQPLNFELPVTAHPGAVGMTERVEVYEIEFKLCLLRRLTFFDSLGLRQVAGDHAS